MVANTHITAEPLDSVLDLRRRHSRDIAETLVKRAEWALPEDRALIHAVYRDGLPASRFASIRGASPRSTCKRVHAVAARLLSAQFDRIESGAPGWPRTRRRVAIACVIQGMSMRRAADTLGLSLHTVRRHMDIVNALTAAPEATR